MKDYDTLYLFSDKGALGGYIKFDLRGSAAASIVQINLTYMGILNTDHWLDKARSQIEEIFSEDFRKAKPIQTDKGGE